MIMSPPRYQHDCDQCVFLGQHGEMDLYWCVSKGSRKLDSVIGRLSSEPSDYLSSHPPGAFAGPTPFRSWYDAALRAAEVKGLYNPKVQGWSEKRGCASCEYRWVVECPYGTSDQSHTECPNCGSCRTFLDNECSWCCGSGFVSPTGATCNTCHGTGYKKEG